VREKEAVGNRMELLDLLSELNKLTRSEKLCVIQLLAQDLETEEADVETAEGASTYEVWSPQDQGDAVETLHKLLQEHRQNQARDAQ
jgi:hypothetical protein